MEDHRQHARYPETSPVRLWLNDYCSLLGQTMDAGADEAFVYFSWLPSDVLRVGETYRIQMYPETKRESTFVATVRHIGPDGIGLAIGPEPADTRSISLLPAPPPARGVVP